MIHLRKQLNWHNSLFGRSRMNADRFRISTSAGWKLLALTVLIVLVSGSAAHAQAPQGNLPPHQAKVTWTNGVDPVGDTISGSNVYRCPGTCTLTSGTFSLLTTTPVSASALSYVDSAVTESTTYTWTVTNLVQLSTGTFETPATSVAVGTIPKAAQGATSVSVAVQ